MYAVSDVPTVPVQLFALPGDMALLGLAQAEVMVVDLNQSTPGLVAQNAARPPARELTSKRRLSAGETRQKHASSVTLRVQVSRSAHAVLVPIGPHQVTPRT